MASRRVVITGLGAVTPLGVGVQKSWASLLAGASGIVSTTPLGPEYAELPSTVAAMVPRGSKVDGAWDAKEYLKNDDTRKMAGFSQFAVVAAEEALADSGWNGSEAERERAGVCIGSGIGSFHDAYDTTLAYHKGGYRKLSPLFVPRLLINLAAGHVSMRHGLQGPNHSVSTACTTGAHSIGDAYRFILHNDADMMLCGGSESCIHPVAIGGFARAKSLATAFNDEPAKASRPFDKARNGFVIGEGAGVLVLEELESARKRGANIYAEVKGYGLSGDSHHMTAPPTDGRGAFLAMKRALVHAAINPGEVDYVNAHATSTPLGDAAENRAIKKLLLEEGGRMAEETAVSSCKGALGHLLGAAGAVEAIMTVLGLKNGILPPTLNLDNPGNLDGEDSEFTMNYVANKPQKADINVALSNSFGFGGTNASLCFVKYKE